MSSTLRPMLTVNAYGAVQPHFHWFSCATLAAALARALQSTCCRVGFLCPSRRALKVLGLRQISSIFLGQDRPSLGPGNQIISIFLGRTAMHYKICRNSWVRLMTWSMFCCHRVPAQKVKWWRNIAKYGKDIYDVAASQFYGGLRGTLPFYIGSENPPQNWLAISAE